MQYSDIVQLDADYVLQYHGCNFFCCFIKISGAISYSTCCCHAWACKFHRDRDRSLSF